MSRKFQDFVNEQSMSRVWQHSKGKNPYAIITAFRDENTLKTNKQKNKSLAAEIKGLGYGYFYVNGHWEETNTITGKKIVTDEDSIFVIGEEKSEDNFKHQLIKLTKEYQQEGVLIKDSAGVNIYDDSGKIIVKLGTFSPSNSASVYTQLRRKNPKNNNFVFESTQDMPGFIVRLAYSKEKQV